ncbi:peroxiredoxin [Sulfuriferula thiophila]|uniref:peroxiredoxin n=1 Tax=Sulfuriferula thiophila TaxID=1781211 RepID=UPI000F6049C0|nr:peroxiredoxin [Sulfuriferula thiophila]
MQIDDLELPATGNKTFKSSDMRGKKLVVYFYPKDDTPGCTVEGSDFRDLYAEFQQLGCEIVGISRDSVSSHEKFKTKLDLPFDLLADEEEKACNLFAVMKLKNMYGNEVRGIDRSTFLFDETGKLIHEWRSVKSTGHAQAVLDTLKAL